MDSGTANYLLLLPLLFKNRIQNIRINSKSEGYDFMKKTGIIRELEDHFTIEDQVKPESPVLSMAQVRKGVQTRILGLLSESPFLRTFLASNNKNRNVLRILSKEYRHILRTSSINEYKISICLIELIDNIFQHSRKSEGAISVHFFEKNRIPFLQITVTDLGIGFRRSMLGSEAYAACADRDHRFFIEEAIKPRISGTDIPGRGFGLPSVVKNCDRISITSGGANLTIFNDSDPPSPRSTDLNKYFRGANIICIVRLDDNKIVERKKATSTLVERKPK